MMISVCEVLQPSPGMQPLAGSVEGKSYGPNCIVGEACVCIVRCGVTCRLEPFKESLWRLGIKRNSLNCGEFGNI